LQEKEEVEEKEVASKSLKDSVKRLAFLPLQSILLTENRFWTFSSLLYKGDQN